MTARTFSQSIIWFDKRPSLLIQRGKAINQDTSYRRLIDRRQAFDLKTSVYHMRLFLSLKSANWNDPTFVVSESCFTFPVQNTKSLIATSIWCFFIGVLYLIKKYQMHKTTTIIKNFHLHFFNGIFCLLCNYYVEMSNTSLSDEIKLDWGERKRERHDLAADKHNAK